MRVCVVGAGVSGLVAARNLQASGHTVTVLDKGRRPGGRACSRRESDERWFDHGAQFFSARAPFMQELVREWEAKRVIRRWRPRILRPAGLLAEPPEPWWVGAPSMGHLCLHLASFVSDLRLSHEVVSLTQTSGGWLVRALAGGQTQSLEADGVLLTLPPTQAIRLVPDLPGAWGSHSPTWAVMVAFSSGVSAPFDVLDGASQTLAWAARECSKPGRTNPRGEDLWTLHASTDWSNAHLEAEPDWVASTLVSAFAECVGHPVPIVAFAKAHRWRYARVNATAEPIAISEARLLVAGDATCSGRIEGAVESGLVAARTFASSVVTQALSH